MEAKSADVRARRLFVPSQRTRAIALAVALLLFAGSTILALYQDSWTDPQTPPAGFQWWLKPRNPPADLPQVGAHLRAVWALPDNHHVWVGGDYAMLLHSHDEGRTWNQIKVDIPAPQPKTAPPNKQPSVTQTKAPTQTKATVPNPAASGNAISKALELPPTPNPAVQAPLNAQQQGPPLAPGPIPYGSANPSTVAAGATVRVQIATTYFRIEKPNASAESPLIRIGTPEFSQDRSLLIVPVTVDPKAPPGPYTIRISGTNSYGKDYELTVQFTVTSAAKSAAGLFSLIPSVYAAEPAQGSSASGVNIAVVRFTAESSGALELDSGVSLITQDGGSKWYRTGSLLVTGCEVVEALPGKRLDAVQCGGEAIPSFVNPSEIGLPTSLAPWQSLFMRGPDVVRNAYHIWIGGANGTILEKDSTDSPWQTRNAPTKARINALFFQADLQRGWAVGSNGAILSTADGGQHWTARTKTNDAPYKAPYSPGPAPWYILSLLLTAALAGIALLSPEAPAAPPAAIEIIGASDRPLEDDRDPDPLAFRPIARGIAYFIRNRRTTPPLNFAITGPWGSGKTSLMRLLRHELVKYGFRPVWFNAWHHQSEDYLLPSLLDTIRQEAVPKLWDRGGIGFRLRLVNARWQWWFPVLGLCFAGAVVFTAMLPNSRSMDLTKLFTSFGAPHGIAIGSAITMLSFLYKWLPAFGVKPAALLSSSGGGARVSDLEKQTSFRYRFAKEFREVTQALGARQMVIFIDDLDRCQPQNTLEVLESVNFLSSSGECFVVMGMAKELVQEYVSGSLEGAAKALTAVADGAPAVTAHDLAGEYLQKLINIEVPVPATDADEMKKLVDSLKTGTEGLAGEPSLLNAVRGIAGVLVPVVLAGSLIYGGGQLGGYFAKQFESGAPNAQTVKKEAGQPSSASAVNPGQPATPAAPAEGAENDTFDPLKIQSSWASLWWALMILPALFWAGYRITTWRPDLEPDDSKEFTAAMEDALPLILDRQRTPRAVKRFVNKVRFIAMRQRQAFRDDRPLWRRVLQPQVPETAPSPAIPEDVLVILAALHQWKSSSVEDGVNLGRALAQWSLKYDAAVLEAWRGRYLEFAAGLRAN